MIITLEEALKGKATRIKNKDYFETKAYLEPFIDRMSNFTNDFRIQAKLPDQITKTKTGEINMDDITFNRLWVQAVLPGELNFPNHKDSVNLLYALDTKTPVVKIARTAINCACLNQCVFNPSFLNVQELLPDSSINFKCVTELMEQTSDICSWLDRLTKIEVEYNEEFLNEMLGKWCRNCLNPKINNYDSGYGKVKLAVSTALDAFKQVYYKKDSSYYVKPGDTTTMFNIYNAWTDIISHNEKDIVNPLEKTLLIKDILNIV